MRVVRIIQIKGNPHYMGVLKRAELREKEKAQNKNK
tara:strand:- start:1455 stop:1562 length:108 start_codon:yes stop_codon:yes gene_type:complete